MGCTQPKQRQQDQRKVAPNMQQEVTLMRKSSVEAIHPTNDREEQTMITKSGSEEAKVMLKRPTRVTRKKAFVTFQVSDVSQRDSPGEFYERSRTDIATEINRHPVMDKKKYPNRKLLTQMNTQNSISSNINNGFVGAAFQAYCWHWNLTLRPDDIWLAITQCFAKFIEKADEKIRKKFFTIEGKMELVAYSVACMQNSADWNDIILQICNKIEQNTVADVRDWLEPNFSTTTELDRTVGRVVLMGAMKKYFGYKMVLRCGIPNITLEGTLQDWINIRARIQKLKEYGIEVNFHSNVDSYQGNVDKDFWN